MTEIIIKFYNPNRFMNGMVVNSVYSPLTILLNNKNNILTDFEKHFKKNGIKAMDSRIKHITIFHKRYTKAHYEIYRFKI